MVEDSNLPKSLFNKEGFNIIHQDIRAAACFFNEIMQIQVEGKVVTGRARRTSPLQAILSRLEAAPTDWRRKILRLCAYPSILRQAQGSAERVGRIIIRPLQKPRDDNDFSL
jgi:hypothetical protein